MPTHSLRTLLTGTLAALTLVSSVAAADFPNRDIRLIVPWSAGGGTDGISRKISDLAEDHLPVSIYAENITGAVSATGLMQLIRSRPDGHTLSVMTYDSVITVPRSELVPGYSLDKMTPIARITQEADAVVVSERSGFSDFDELIEAAKAEPDTVRIGVMPEGSGPYLAARRLEEMTGADFNIITYPGAAAAESEALLSGEIDAAIASLGDFAGLIDSGDVRGVAELASEQNPTYQDVPPISELGFELESGSFIVLVAPENTPEDVIQTIESAYHDAFTSDEFQQWVAKVGVTPSWLGSEKVADWMYARQQETYELMDELEL
ncbi:Bug family tripartite tricarboxylate transporter substrate binding protein [Aidingimonas lacisalsi]|uniref:Bug family tripartite tricarboxylate transporter substrate binding protein n=1 Tax=Aidingimonas lacisalsi TaxID=2604086 RepID=UPI0011D1E5FF|nr:tripartite tricarboxylate transporter substrate binding protein [Aidingimonas lacisalsi]